MVLNGGNLGLVFLLFASFLGIKYYVKQAMKDL